MYVPIVLYEMGITTEAPEHLKAQGFTKATLFVFEGNARARKFYERAGWKNDGHSGISVRYSFSLPVLRYRTVCC
jgi:hypothetical protein